MKRLEGFELYKGSAPIRPSRGQKKATISSNQVTFSKELVLALGSPKTVDLFVDREGNRIAIRAATRGSVRFAGKKGRKDGKVIQKNPCILELFHSFLEPLKSGTYYCVKAEFLAKERAAIFNMGAAERYETDEELVEKLKNSRRKNQGSR